MLEAYPSRVSRTFVSDPNLVLVISSLYMVSHGKMNPKENEHISLKPRRELCKFLCMLYLSWAL